MLKQKVFKDKQEFMKYQDTLFLEPKVMELVDQINLRFEDKVRHAVTVRHEIREGIRQSDEQISITLYGWIQKFMSLTKKVEIVEDVEVQGQKGQVHIHLYDLTSEFVPYEK